MNTIDKAKYTAKYYKKVIGLSNDDILEMYLGNNSLASNGHSYDVEKNEIEIDVLKEIILDRMSYS